MEHILNLPVETLLDIFGRLPLVDLVRIGRVCHAFHQLSRHPILWRQVDLSVFKRVLTDKALLSLSSALSAAESLNLSRCSSLTNSLPALSRMEFPRLRSLNLHGTCFSAESIYSFLVEHGTRLTSLSLRNTSINRNNVGNIIPLVTNLTALDISGTKQRNGVLQLLQQYGFSTRLRRLELVNNYAINDEGFRMLLFPPSPASSADENTANKQAVPEDAVPHRTYFEHLNLRSLFKITDRSLGWLAQSCGPTLTELSLNHCYRLTDAGIVTFIQGCPHLQAIFLRSVSTVRDSTLFAIAAHCTRLRMLDITDCPSVSDAGVRDVVAHCTRLEYLALANNTAITDEALATDQLGWLHTLDLTGCLAITDRGLRYVAANPYLCMRLERLDIQSNYISADGVECILRNCSQLFKLDVQRSANLTDEVCDRVAAWVNDTWRNGTGRRPRLGKFNIRDTAITPTGLARLARLFNYVGMEVKIGSSYGSEAEEEK